MEDDNHFNPNRRDSADARTRQYAAHAIFILGPSSSGKTTLCDAIARSLQVDPANYIKEIARNVMKTYGFSRADTDTYEMQHTILLAQVAAEEEVLKRIGSSDAILLSDRSAIDPIVYASTSKVPGTSDRKQRLLDNPALSAILPFYKTSLFIVLQPVIEWMHDDGIRSLEDPWAYNENLFRTLKELGISYNVIDGNVRDLAERVEYVKTLFTSTIS